MKPGDWFIRAKAGAMRPHREFCLRKSGAMFYNQREMAAHQISKKMLGASSPISYRGPKSFLHR
jgi:hypothetical protein